MAFESLQRYPSTAPDADTNPLREARCFLTKIINKFSTSFEYSIQQAGMRLLELPSEYSSQSVYLIFMKQAIDFSISKFSGITMPNNTPTNGVDTSDSSNDEIDNEDIIDITNVQISNYNNDIEITDSKVGNNKDGDGAESTHTIHNDGYGNLRLSQKQIVNYYHRGTALQYLCLLEYVILIGVNKSKCGTNSLKRSYDFVDSFEQKVYQFLRTKFVVPQLSQTRPKYPHPHRMASRHHLKKARITFMNYFRVLLIPMAHPSYSKSINDQWKSSYTWPGFCKIMERWNKSALYILNHPEKLCEFNSNFVAPNGRQNVAWKYTKWAGIPSAMISEGAKYLYFKSVVENMSINKNHAAMHREYKNRHVSEWWQLPKELRPKNLYVPETTADAKAKASMDIAIEMHIANQSTTAKGDEYITDQVANVVTANKSFDKIWNRCGFNTNNNTTRASRSKTKNQTIDFNFINNWFTDYNIDWMKTQANNILDLNTTTTANGHSNDRQDNTPKYQLYDKQQEIFNYIQKNINEKKQVKILIDGIPGSGKTILANEIAKLFNSDETYASAPTGIAATLLRIGDARGVTCHSLFILMGGQSGKRFEQRLSILIKVVKKVKFLIIDEISMLQSDLFNRINANLVNALNHIQEKTPLHPCLEYLDSAKPFINLNLCLLGDFFQLPPPSGQSLALAAVRNAMFSQVQKFYKNKPSLVQYAQNGRNGGFLFTQFKRFTLNEQKRSLDPVHSKFIEGFRTKKRPITKDLIRHIVPLQTRLKDLHNEIQQCNDQNKKKQLKSELDAWKFPTYIVTANKTRRSINRLQAERFAKEHNKILFAWHDPYILSTTSYTDKKTGERRCKHEAEPLDEAGIASTSQLRFHQLNDLDCVSYFVEGAEYGILDNYNPEQGIANGTTGIGVSLTWADKYITHVKKSISKAKKDARKKPGQLITCFVPRPVSINVKVDNKIVVACKNNTEQNNKTVSHAATLTFALTTFKVQGKCKERVVLLLDRRPGLKNGFKNIDLHGVYVALSRVRYGKHIARLGKGGVDMFKYLRQMEFPNLFTQWDLSYTDDGTFKYKHHDIHYYESLKKITNLRDKKQVTVKFLQEILHKAGLNYGKRKRNDLIKLVAPLWQGVHKITNDKRYKL